MIVSLLHEAGAENLGTMLSEFKRLKKVGGSVLACLPENELLDNECSGTQLVALAKQSKLNVHRDADHSYSQKQGRDVSDRRPIHELTTDEVFTLIEKGQERLKKIEKGETVEYKKASLKIMLAS